MNVRIASVAGALVAAGCGPAPAQSAAYDGADASTSVAPASNSGTGSDAGETPDASMSAFPESDGNAGDAGGPIGNVAADASDASVCIAGQVTPNEVVMLGDSYFDPAWANTALDIFGDAQDAGSLAANTTYRHYYIGAASMGWGNPDTQWYIPYQYDPMAKTDTAVVNPRDIKVIIMDGGGNDVLIGNNSCETTAPPANTSCATTIQTAIAKAQSMLQEVVSDGVETIVYLFYPHLDPAGGGILLTPAPTVNEALDYAYPLAESICCGSSFTSTASNYTCTGTPVPGSKTRCIFVDTRPAFEGHLADYIKDDHVHPSPAGAQVMADLVWNAMRANCVAQ